MNMHLFKNTFVVFGLPILIVGVIIAVILYVQNTTVPETLGVTKGSLAELASSPNGVASHTQFEERKVDPFPLSQPTSESIKNIRKAIASGFSESQYKVETYSERYMHVVFISDMIGYRDDVEFFVDSNKNEVQLRSQSRAGYSDGDVNRVRMEQIRQAYIKLISAS
jgi:uncharacterized protein (DUF1499 family)